MSDIGQQIEVLGFVAGSGASFGAQALEWNAFFTTVAQVAGSLVGLVFVALTFNNKLGNDGDTGLRDLARQTFGDFLNLLVVSLTMLIPHTAPVNVGVFMVIAGVAGIIRISLALMRILRRQSGHGNGRELVQRFFLSLLGNVGLLIAGVLVFSPDFNASMFWSTLFGSMIGLLLSGTRSAWMLVVPKATAC